MSKSIILPTLNELENIQKLIPEIIEELEKIGDVQPQNSCW